MAPSRPPSAVPEARSDDAQAESVVTVLVALAANALIAVAKTVAAVLTGAASMVAEAAHSWADTGNEVLLWIAGRRSSKLADDRHPLGYGREAYVWSLFAAFGLFAIGSVISITHGVQELITPEPAELFVVSYIVLGIAFVLEGISFRRALNQARDRARMAEHDLLEHVIRTSDPTLRAVFFEDAGALVGLVIAFFGIFLHQVTGSAVPDAIGSILVGVLLGVIAVGLIVQNRRFIVGVAVDPRIRAAVLRGLLAHPQVTAVTYLHIEYVGPGRVVIVAAVDLEGDEAEHTVARRLNALEDELEAERRVARAILTLSRPGEAPLRPDVTV
ncbi:cation diffusion facilitator family transporter [Microbacterium sp. B2969]|uniref:Cation diffusion facilitator family transporter n=1 Tax=Microbacterium alkaliflavum TaxID=3248839 RepID=A0ABW7QBX4_9MICO